MARARWSLLAVCALVAPSVARADDDPCPADPAPAHCYLMAASAVRETKPADAAALYLESYHLDPKVDALAGYGFALAGDKQYVAAAEVLTKAVEDYEALRVQLEQSNADATTLFPLIHRIDFAKEVLASLATKTGQVRLTLPPGVHAVRKGASDLRGSDPLHVVVAPNSDILVFTYASGKTLDVEVAVPAGTISTIEAPPEPRPPPRPPPPPPPELDESIGMRRVAYAAGIVGGVVLVGGFTYITVADVPSTGFGAGVFVVGSASVAASIYLFWTADHKHKAWRARNPTAIVPIIGDHTVGAAVRIW